MSENGTNEISNHPTYGAFERRIEQQQGVAEWTYTHIGDLLTIEVEMKDEPETFHISVNPNSSYDMQYALEELDAFFAEMRSRQ